MFYFAGVLRGCGRQALGATINLTAYYLIGVPLGLLLGFRYHLNAKVGVLCKEDVTVNTVHGGPVGLVLCFFSLLVYPSLKRRLVE